MSGIRTLIFDCYGTLIDIKTNDDKDEVFNYLSLYLRYYGANTSAERLRYEYRLEKERFLETRGEQYPEFDMEAVFASILKRDNLNNNFMVESCCKLFRLISREKFQLFPDCLPILKTLRDKGYSIYMLSNAQKSFCLQETEMLGLSQFFKYSIISSQLGFKKPDPRIFSIACALAAVAPENAVYIGDDTESDVKGPQKIGMNTILIDREQKKKNDVPRPSFYATSMSDVLDWLEDDA